MIRKKVPFRARGKSVSFTIKTKKTPSAKRTIISRRNKVNHGQVTIRKPYKTKVKVATQKLVEAGLAYVYPPTPVILAAGRLAKELLRK